MDDLNYNQSRLDSIDKTIKEWNERKRKLVEKNKMIVYDKISKLYKLEGTELLDAVNNEHSLLEIFLNKGMSLDDIYTVLINNSSNNNNDDELQLEITEG